MSRVSPKNSACPKYMVLQKILFFLLVNFMLFSTVRSFSCDAGRSVLNSIGCDLQTREDVDLKNIELEKKSSLAIAFEVLYLESLNDVKNKDQTIANLAQKYQRASDELITLKKLNDDLSKVNGDLNRNIEFYKSELSLSRQKADDSKLKEIVARGKTQALAHLLNLTQSDLSTCQKSLNQSIFQIQKKANEIATKDLSLNMSSIIIGQCLSNNSICELEKTRLDQQYELQRNLFCFYGVALFVILIICMSICFYNLYRWKSLFIAPSQTPKLKSDFAFPSFNPSNKKRKPALEVEAKERESKTSQPKETEKRDEKQEIEIPSLEKIKPVDSSNLNMVIKKEKKTQERNVKAEKVTPKKLSSVNDSSTILLPPPQTSVTKMEDDEDMQNIALTMKSDGYSAHEIDNALKIFREDIMAREKEKDESSRHDAILRERIRINNFAVKSFIPGDGNCQFAAVSDQLYGSIQKHDYVRRAVVEWIEEFKYHQLGNGVFIDDFFLDNETSLEASVQKFCQEMSRNGVWGDHVTLMVIAERFGREIVVVTSSGSIEQCITKITPREIQGKPIYLSHRHENHYGSLSLL